MITLHIGQDIREVVLPLLNAKGITDVVVYDEEDPLFSKTDKYHITTFSNGGNRASGRNTSTQNFDIEVRGANTSVAKDITERIGVYLQDTYTGLCELPIVPNISNRIYSNCRITDITNIYNLGKDSENKVVFRISAEITYNKN